MISNLFHRFSNLSSSERRRTSLTKARRSKLRNSLRPEPLEDRRLLAGVFGYKFEDLNANGIDDGEPRVPGVEVSILVDDGVSTPFTQIDITDAAGEYQFPDLPAATMTVTETPPIGSFQTTVDPTPFFLNDIENAVAIAGQGGTVIPELAFGNAYTSSIHGFKFEDLDADGIYEPGDGDLPQANVPFQLTGVDSSGQFVTLITNTDASGQFWFEDLLPSVSGQGQQTGYTVTEIVRSGYYPTTDIPQRNFDLPGGIELAWQTGAAMLGPNDPQQEVVVGQELIFGNTASVSIHGFKFEDIDGDGQYDPNEGELPLAGVEFSLTGTDGQGNIVNETEFTDANGEFWFVGPDIGAGGLALLPSVTGQGPGTGYTVTETVPFAFANTTPIVRSFDIRSRQEWVWRDGAAMLPPTPVPQVDQTQQDNEVPDPLGETVFRAQSFVPSLTGGLTQVELSIEGVAGVGDVVLEIQTLNAAGRPSGSVLASATIPSANVPIGSNQTISFDFSGAPPTLVAGFSYAMVLSSPNSTSQSAFGWDSSDDNDPYASGVSFRSGDSGGNWIPFADFDHVFTTFMRPQADPRIEVLATANGGPLGDQLIFGNTVPGSFHGFKFIDLNRNGAFDPNFGEQPQAGVEFQLTGTDGLGNPVNQTQTTDANGQFWFVGLSPSVAGQGQGTGYTITEIVPAGFAPTTPTERTFDLRSRQEFVWQRGAAMLNPDLPQVEVIVGEQLIFGNISTGSFHGFKFEDLDGDGVFDPDELPLPGIAFQLTGTDNNGALVNRREVTDQTGQFWFEDLIPSIDGQGQGTGYTITEIVPTGFIPTTPSSRFFDLPGGVEYAWQTGAAMLDPNDPNIEQVVGEQLIFGNTVPGSIHGFKFLDLDGDGIYDPNFGEIPQPGVEFQLNGTDGLGNQINRSGFTNGNGEFWFVGLPPSVDGQGQGTGYTITEIVPAGFVPTTPTARTFNLNSRQELVWQTGAAMLDPQFDPQIEVLVGQELVFSNTITGSFHGFKFLDRDGDGVYEPNAGDLPQAGVEFQLTGTDALGNVIDITETTNTNGEFWFEELFPSVDGQGQGTGYTIAEIVPQGFVATTPIVRTFNLLGRQELVWRDGAAALDPQVDLQQEVVVGRELIFGNTITGSFHGFKFADNDANGQYDPATGDTPQPNVDFRLTGTSTDGNPVDITMSTDASGQFWFEDLAPSVAGQGFGTGYTITEIVPAGHVPTTGLTTRTFDLFSGQELAWQQDAAMLGPNDPQIEIVVGGELIFGNTIPGSFHGFKFEDYDGDGNYDPNAGDVPQANVGFQLTGTDGQGNFIQRTEFTDDNGQFWFEDLLASIPVPGQGQATGYTITELVPFGFQPTTGAIQRAFTLESGQELAWQVGAAMLDPDFDPQTEVVVGDELIYGNTVPGSLHGFKFYDFDGDGIYEPNFGDVPMVDVEFTLSGIDGLGNPINRSVFTNPNGEFWFVGLPPSVAGQGQGTGYTITEIVPIGFVSTTAPLSRTFDLGSREELVWVPGAAMLTPRDPQIEVFIDSDDSGLYEELMWGNTRPGQIHGYKFNDSDGDGVPEPGEPRLAGFEIQLLNADGAVIATEITDINGEYWFLDLVPGTYFVQEVQQPGYQQTTHNPPPIAITRGEVYVALAGQSMLDPRDSRNEIIEKCLIFGNQPTGEITWRKENKNGLLGGVIFELTRTHSYSITTGLFTDIVDEPITVVDNLLPDTNPTFGLFAVKDLQLGRYTLRESVPVPGYDPDLFVETFNITDDNRFQDAEHIFFNTWSKRAFVGSTLALRLAYLDQIGLAEATSNQQQLQQAALETGGAAETEQFRMSINVGEASGSNKVEMLHAASGILIAEGELADEFAVVTTNLAEHVRIGSMPNFVGPLTITTADGDDIIELTSSDFASIDAGEGEDVLRVLADGTFDFAALVNRLIGVEEISLAGEGEQRISIDRTSVDAASTNQPLLVRTQRSGQLSLDTGWTLGDPIRVGNSIVQPLTSGTTVLHITSASPFQNALNRFDVDRSGGVSALDALQVINGMAAGEGESFAGDKLTGKYFDVNGDGRWSALDALQIINHLGSSSAGAEGESAAANPNIVNTVAQDAAIAEFNNVGVVDADKVIGQFAVASDVAPSAFVGYGQSDGATDNDDDLEAVLTTLANELN